ncbi:MAG: fatty acid desaturase [Cyanobacteria bacterium P01_A01_bin.114]
MLQVLGNHAQLAKDLRAAVADLNQVNPWMGMWRFMLLGAGVVSLSAIAWQMPNPSLFVGVTVLAGLVYAFGFICTHDATHQTLTGWRWFDTVMPRLVSWPMLWPFGTYAILHRLHHSWNGLDLRDPERVHWTCQEYQQAHPLVRWYVRHQWVVDIFVLSGIGLIIKTLIHGVNLQDIQPRLRTQMALDLASMALIQSSVVSFIYFTGHSVFKYLLFWLLIERTVGMVMQTRDHIEHYGLWGTAGSYQLTQLYNCRNIRAGSFQNWLMGGLPYHSIHHAFPEIPFDQLPAAFHRIEAVLAAYQLPSMTLEQGYLSSTLSWVSATSMHGDPALIDTNHLGA